MFKSKKEYSRRRPGRLAIINCPECGKIVEAHDSVVFAHKSDVTDKSCETRILKVASAGGGQ